MKAVTIQQPYAAMVAQCLKFIENRCWQTHHRGWLAIHAGKSKKALHDYTSFVVNREGLDFGSIVAVSYVGASVQIDDFQGFVGMYPGKVDWIVGNEHALGPHCWIFTATLPLQTPIPCNGKQGLWTVPKKVLTKMREQWLPEKVVTPAQMVA